MNRQSILTRFLTLLLLSMLSVAFFSGVPSKAVDSEADWSMFRHDPTHIGYSTSIAPLTNDVLWTCKTGSGILSSPTVVDGVVYIGSDEVRALNATTGTLKWSYKTGVFVHSSPAVAKGTLYVESANTLQALNATTGTYLWNYTLIDEWVEPSGVLWFISSPCVVDGVLYVGSVDTNVYAFGFSHSQSASFPIAPIAAIAVVAIVSISLVLYFKTRKH